VNLLIDRNKEQEQRTACLVVLPAKEQGCETNTGHHHRHCRHHHDDDDDEVEEQEQDPFGTMMLSFRPHLCLC